MKSEDIVVIHTCADCGTTRNQDDMELAPDGEWYHFACLNYTLNFTNED